jgi:hypothetical protein
VTVAVAKGDDISIGGSAEAVFRKGAAVCVGSDAAKAIPPHADIKRETPKVKINVFCIQILLIKFPDET